MRDLKNNKIRLLVGMFVWLFVVVPVRATEVTEAHTELRENNYVLFADIDYQLSEKAKEALENGVSLFWTLRIKVMRERDYLWARTEVETAIHYRLQYHALLNMYRVVIIKPDSKEKNGDSYNFSSLSSALNLMASVEKLPLLEQSSINPEKQYFVQIKADFEIEALPLPLQTIAYINPQWYLSSDWTTWPLKK
jgi:hypothetical protein